MGSLLTKVNFSDLQGRLSDSQQSQQKHYRTRMTRYSSAVVRHHRGSAAVAKCGAEIHDRGNLQLCERAFWVQWQCELLAMNGGKIDLGSLLTKVYLSDIRGRVSDPHRQPPNSTTATNKKDADLKKSASCAQNRTRTYTSLNTRT